MVLRSAWSETPTWALDFAELFKHLREDIFKFARAVGMEEPTCHQVEIMKAVNDGATHIAAKSGQGVGKTAIESIIGLWRAFRSVGAQTVVLAPTERQSKDLWLGEVRLWLSRSAPEIQRLFDCQVKRVNICGNRDWGIRLMPVGGNKSMTVSGEHNDYLTIIIDEGAGIPREVLETMYGTLTNADPLLAIFGNPNIRDCGFFDCFNRDREMWRCFTFSAEESPITSAKNIERLERTYGRESDVFRVRVLGEFPDQDPNCVMSSDDLEACAKNPMLECARMNKEKQFGIDLARFGSDESTIYRRSGNAIVEWKRFAKTEPVLVLAEALEMQRRAAWRDDHCWFVFDEDGMGQGKRPLFPKSRQVRGFHSAGSAPHPQEFDDAMTEAFFHMGRMVKERIVHIPNDPILIHQLSSRKYFVTLKGQLKIDSKEEWKKDQQETRSPDRADGCVMSFYNFMMGGGRVARAPQRKRRNVAPGSVA